MKKLALVIAIAMVAAFAAPAMASDVSISGEHRTLYVYDDPGYTSPAADEAQYIQQRFRTQVVIKANDNVTAFLRVDLAEEIWGLGADSNAPLSSYGNVTGKAGDAWRRPNTGEDTLQVDRSYVQIKSGMFTLQAGQQFMFQGMGTILNANLFGLKGSFNLKPVKVDLVYSKLSENLATTDENTNEDEDLYLAQVSFAGDGFSVGGIVGNRADDATDFDLMAYGLFASAKLGGVMLRGEFDMFSGDTAAGTDVEGTQMWLQASFAVNDMFTLKGDLLYAQGQDGTDTQATTLNQFGVACSPLEWEGALVATAGGWGTHILFDLDNVAEGAGTGDNSGVMGAVVTAKVTPMDTLTLWGKIGYLEPEEDNNTNVDSMTVLVGEINWQWMPNVVLAAGVQMVTPDFDDASDDDEEIKAVAKLGVSF